MKMIAISLLSVLSIAVHAAPVQVGRPTYAGNGCPAGTAQFLVSADGQNYILKPSQFVVHTGQDNGKRIDRQTCNIAVSLNVAPGYAAGLVTRVSGFVAADSQSKVTINEEIFFAGSTGQRLAKTYTNVEQNLILSSSSSPAKIAYSACGASSIARINLAVLAQGNESTAALEDIRFRLVIKKCK